MDRFAIFVDAGYFFAAGSQIAFGDSLQRKNISISSIGGMISALVEEAKQMAGYESVLRTYWYDAMPGNSMSMDQTALALSAGVKLRLGAMNSAGQQKGVDSLIVTDLIDLARNHAIEDAIIVGGDEDLRIAVQMAQSLGTKVHILAIGDYKHNVSPSLQMEADSIRSLDASWFRTHLTQTNRPLKIEPTVPVSTEDSFGDEASVELSLEDVTQATVDECIKKLMPEQIEGLKNHFRTQKGIPHEYDGPLIASVSAALGGLRLSGKEMGKIRGTFITAVKSMP